MKNYKIFLIAILLSTITNYAQDKCLSGNCNGGYGIARVTNNTIYEGYFVENYYSKYGTIEGIGKMRFKNKSIYTGEFKSNGITGYGIIKYADKSEVQGHFKNGKVNGIAIVLDKDGNPIKAGYFIDDKIVNALNANKSDKNPVNCVGNCYDGYGKIIKDGKLISAGIYEKGSLVYGFLNFYGDVYIGTIKDNKPNGYAQLFYNMGATYFGYFKDGVKEGYGTQINGNEVIETGIWKNNILIDQKNKKTFLLEVTDEELIKAIKKIPNFSKKERKKLKKNAKATNKPKFLDYFEYGYVNYKDGTNENVTISFLDINNNNYSQKTLAPNKLTNALEKCGFTFVEFKDKTLKYTFEDKKISLFRTTDDSLVLRVDYK